MSRFNTICKRVKTNVLLANKDFELIKWNMKLKFNLLAYFLILRKENEF
jgi:hypothetical protein